MFLRAINLYFFVLKILIIDLTNELSLSHIKGGGDFVLKLIPSIPILDETTTTPDLIDQNILYAKIMVKPARAIEYIAIDFVVASTGASFDD